MPRVPKFPYRESGEIGLIGQRITRAMTNMWFTQVVTLPFIHNQGGYNLWVGGSKRYNTHTSHVPCPDYSKSHIKNLVK